MKRKRDRYLHPEDTGILDFEKNIERVVFEKMMVNLTETCQISKHHLSGWKLDAHVLEDYGMPRLLAFTLRNFMIHGSRNVLDHVVVPVSWLDHLKLDINLWAKKYLLQSHLFFTNIARAITSLKLTPKFREIHTKITEMRYCPHLSSDHRTHFEFLQFKDVPVFEETCKKYGKC